MSYCESTLNVAYFHRISFKEISVKKMQRRAFLKLGGASVIAGVAGMLGGGGAVEAAPVSRSTPVTRICALANVNVRAEASIYSNKIGTLYLGQTIAVVAVSADYNWWCIRWGGYTAWVTADPRWIVPISWRR